MYFLWTSRFALCVVGNILEAMLARRSFGTGGSFDLIPHLPL
jgi:hypothetical protein